MSIVQALMMDELCCSLNALNREARYSTAPAGFQQRELVIGWHLNYILYLQGAFLSRLDAGHSQPQSPLIVVEADPREPGRTSRAAQ